MGKRERVLFDTNLLIRFLTADDPEKATAVENLIIKAERGDMIIILPSIIVAELVWVLESYYHLRAPKIAELIVAIMNTPGVSTSEKSIIAASLSRYKIEKIDFIDAYLIEYASHKEITTVFTFDRRHFKDIENINIEIPK